MYELQGKRVFVAGHRGMVGSAVVKRLAAENCTVLTAPRDTVNLERQADVERFFTAERPQAVVMAAAKVGGILANDREPVEFLQRNLTMELNVIKSAHEAGVEKLLFLGSSCIYPKFADQPIEESSLLTGALVMGLLCLTGLMPFRAPAVDVVLAGVEVPWWMPILWVAGVATTLDYAFGVMAVPRIGSRVASFVGLSEVLFALAFAWIFLAEVPAPIQFVGGALLLAGVVLVRADASSSGNPRGEAAVIS